MHDTRTKASSVVRTSRAQDAIQLKTEVTGVQYHPQTEHLFVTSDGRGNVALRDTRMSFGSRSERSGGGIVLNVRYTFFTISFLKLKLLAFPSVQHEDFAERYGAFEQS